MRNYTVQARDYYNGEKKMPWNSIGDVNPIEHGTTWIAQESDTTFYVAKLSNHGGHSEDDKYTLEIGYVNLNDPWINKEEVEKIYDVAPSILHYVADVFDYYGLENFQGEYFNGCLYSVVDNLADNCNIYFEGLTYTFNELPEDIQESMMNKFKETAMFDNKGNIVNLSELV